MKSLLQLNTSIFSDAGQSTRLADAFVAARRAIEPGLKVVVRDFARDPVPHLTAEGFQGFLAKPEARTPVQAKVVAYSDALILYCHQQGLLRKRYAAKDMFLNLS